MRRTDTSMRASMTGMREAADHLSMTLRGLSDEIYDKVAGHVPTLRDDDSDLPEVTTCYAIDTSLGRLVWRDPRRDDGRLPTSDRFATVRIMRQGSFVASIRLPHRTPRSALVADDQASLARLLRSLGDLVDDGDWSPRTSDAHATAALYAASGGREGILRWPNPWTGASFTTLEAMKAELAPGAVPIEADFEGWRDFADRLSPCLDMTAAVDRDTGIHTLSVSLRTERVTEPGNALDAMRALAIHRRERRP